MKSVKFSQTLTTNGRVWGILAELQPQHLDILDKCFLYLTSSYKICSQKHWCDIQYYASKLIQYIIMVKQIGEYEWKNHVKNKYCDC